MAAEDGTEKRTMRTVLGVEDDGISTSGTFDVVVKDHGVKSGLQYDSVCITPIDGATAEDATEKTVQVLYTQDPGMQGSLRFATVAVCEAPREVTDETTISKVVRLRSSDNPAAVKAALLTTADESEQVAFASDSEALKCVGFGPNPGAAGALSNDEQEGVFASDPEALKCLRFGPRSQASDMLQGTDESDGIFASDPEALKYVRLSPKPQATGASSTDESEGIFASDPEALKCVRLGPKPQATGASSTDESEGIFASDPEGAAVFASDSEALKYIRLTRRPLQAASAARSDLPPSTVSKTSAVDGEGELLAEATGVQLKDNRTYSVRVSGQELPDGQQKKFVSVRSSDGRGGPTREEIDSMQVTVETKVSEDGLVEKFIVVE